MIDPGEKSATRAVEAISSQKNRKKMKKVPSMTAEWFDEGSDDYGVWIKEGGSVEWVEDVRCLGCGGVWPFLSALKGS